MKFKSSIILVLAALWGLGSWWWYTCNIKGFCSMATNQVAANSAYNNPTDDENQDNDKDGIRNGDEKRLGTDPNNTDTDGDGVPDLVEISQIPNDTDNDGLIDALDDDDDNDGILTKNEQPDRNNDGRVDDALDSDNNGTPDYLQANKVASKDTEASVVTALVEEGAVDIYRPETQAAAMTADEEKRLNRGTLSPAPIVPEPPATETTTSTKIATLTDTKENSKKDSKEKTDSEAKKSSSTDNNKSATESTSKTTEKEKPTSKTKTADSTSSTSKTDQDQPSKSTTSKTKETAKESSETTEKAKSADKAKSSKTETAQESKAEPEPQDPEGKDRNKMVVYQNGKSTDTRLGPARLNFPTGLARPALSDETADYFDTVAAYLQKHKRATIKITGHTDSRGAADLNEKLALKRAEIVRDALIGRGAPEKQLQVNSMGESKPIASNNTAEGRQQNRRVEIMPLK
ncbi:OmpA family protein [Thiofilum flexile]|uniref:OmpA family protein n=1 Tax=Thiofilum flexile TaxID=125627 RepID=UPI0003600BEE|nr:OmpA family protein [Thiofilum flexile]